MSTSYAVAGPAGAMPARIGRGASFWPAVMAVAQRPVLRVIRTPQLLVFSALQSVVFLVLFRYVFGGAISVQGQRYVDFLVPGFVATSVLISGVGASIAVAEDVERGFTDRLRSLPVQRLAVLTGRCLADTALVVWGLAFAALLGFAFGFRIHGSVMDAIAAFGLCVVFGFVFGWMFIALGLIAGSGQAAQMMSMPVWPFLFLSSAYVPVDTLPGWLQGYAGNQPISPMVNAVRGLTGGAQAEAALDHSTSYYVVLSLLWGAVIMVGFGLLAVARFSRR